MRPSTRARRLELAVQSNLGRLDRLLAAATAGSWDRISEDLVAYAAIEAQNTWTNFARAYYFSCFANVRLTSGTRVTTSSAFASQTLADAQGYAINKWKTKKLKPNASGKWAVRDEPPWFNPDTLLALCADLGCSNLPSIQAALSPKPEALGSLPAFRHFFAHRNQATMAEALLTAASLGLPTSDGPARALIYRPSTLSAGKLSTWLSELATLGGKLCA